MADLNDKLDTSMGDFGRLTSIKDLPNKTVLKHLIKQAMVLNNPPESTTTEPKPKRTTKPELLAPEAFLKALGKNEKAKLTFENFSPSHRREYIEWILEAKREETAMKRIESSIEMLSEGKPRNWKYSNC